MCSKKRPLFIFSNNYQKFTDSNDFGTLNPEKIWHEHLTRRPHLSDVATLPWEIKKSFSTVLFIHTSDYLRYRKRKKNCNPVAHPPENVTTLTSEMQNFLSWPKVCCVPSTHCWWLWKEPVWGWHWWLQKNWQWCVATTLCLKKKQDTKLLPITSPNVNRFSKFFHW